MRNQSEHNLSKNEVAGLWNPSCRIINIYFPECVFPINGLLLVHYTYTIFSQEDGLVSQFRKSTPVSEIYPSIKYAITFVGCGLTCT